MKGRALLLLAAGYLLVTLIDQLRVEWTLNEQYHYGWAVPFLAAYAAYRSAKRGGQSSAGTSKVLQRPWTRWGFGLLLFLLLPLRLIQEANSDWRLISWALALDIVCLGGFTLYFFGGSSALKRFGFPLAFLLVAVPWPSGLEE